MMPTPIKKVLSNGLRVIMVPLQETSTAMVMILAETGSEYESKEQNGISHFLEHMCFKGTAKRPSSKVINNELDSLGAATNAFTSCNYTGFYAKAHSDKVEHILDIVSDIYLNSTFPEAEIEKEKGVVIEEINMYEDRPQSKVWDVLNEAVFGDQPAGRNIAGTKETVSSFTREDLVKYHQEHYVPEATTIVISGKIDEAKILSKVETIFGALSPKPKSSRPPVIEKQTEPKVAIHFKESDQTHIVVCFRSFINRYDDAKAYPAGMLGVVLGGGMGSRLFHRIRDELGLAYYVHASHSCDIDYGQFTISLGVSNRSVTQALEAVFDELKKIKKEMVPEEELRRVKDMRLGHFYLGLETSNDWADFYGFQEVYRDEIESPEDVVAKREAVTALDMLKIAKDIFRPENLTIAVVGPIKDEKAVYDTILL
jgi:predicted Zn-dependent peptidase